MWLPAPVRRNSSARRAAHADSAVADLGLLQLTSPAPAAYAPVRLDTGSPASQPGAAALVVGWGGTLPIRHAVSMQPARPCWGRKHAKISHK